MRNKLIDGVIILIGMITGGIMSELIYRDGYNDGYEDCRQTGDICRLYDVSDDSLSQGGQGGEDSLSLNSMAGIGGSE